MKERPVIAVVDASSDFGSLLEIIFGERYKVVFIDSTEIKNGITDIVKITEEYHPSAVIYEIEPPYQDNLKNFSENVKGSEKLRDKIFILTTTASAERVDKEKLGNVPILYKPFNIWEAKEAVDKVLRIKS